MSKQKTMSRKEELFNVTTTVSRFITLISEQYHITISEMFVLMNTLYADVLDDIARSTPDNVTEEEMKAFMKDKVGLLLTMIDEQIPIKVDNNE